MSYLEGKEEASAIEWMEVAGRIARHARCLRDKCGAVIVRDGVVIGAGYNAPPLDMDDDGLCLTELPPSPKPKSDRTCCVHAEWRAIMDALQATGETLSGASLYFTRVDTEGEILKSGQPYCTVCSRLALDSGVTYFVLWHDEGIRVYPTDEYNRLSYGLTAE